MGQAGRAPKPHYGRKFDISSHAVQRFRERVDEDMKARPDHDLMNLLDSRMQNAKRQEDVIDHTYRNAIGGTPSTVYVIEDRNGGTALAVVRENTCVTVLDMDMLEVNLASKAWTNAPINTPFKNALGGVKPTRKAAVAAPAISENYTGAFSSSAFNDPPAPPPQDPIAAAGAAYASALLERARARERVLDLDKEVIKARDAHEIACALVGKALEDMHVAINSVTNADADINHVINTDKETK